MMEEMHYIGECLMPVRWSDLDSYGHVNNSRYFEYMTEGRGKVFSHLFTPYDETQYVLVFTSCSFKKSVLYPNNILMKHYLKAIGRTSFTIFCQMLSEDGSVLYAESEAKLVCLDQNTQKPIPVPEELRARLL